MRFLGTVILFLMGVAMFTGDIEYRTGSNITASGSDYTVVDTYTAYQNHMIGLFISILAAVTFGLTFLEIRNARKEDDEE